jgi:hypothetical protein
VEKPYRIAGKGSSEELGRYLPKDGQALLPIVELIELSKMAVDELIDVLGLAQGEAVLPLSADAFASGAEQHDDMTVVVLRCRSDTA